VPTTERYLGCKQNLGHLVNDLFDLGKDIQVDQTNFQSAVNASTPVEMVFRQEMNADKEDRTRPPVCDARPLSFAETNRFGRGQKRPSRKSFRRCSGSGTSRSDSESKENGQRDPEGVGSVGLEHHLTNAVKRLNANTSLAIRELRMCCGDYCMKIDSVRKICADCGKRK
jgi:hypothetical protein